jgi:hypothetical protein
MPLVLVSGPGSFEAANIGDRVVTNSRLRVKRTQSTSAPGAKVMSVAAAFPQVGFPTEFLLLFVFVAVAGILMLFGLFVGVKRERRERKESGGGS